MIMMSPGEAISKNMMAFLLTSTHIHILYEIQVLVFGIKQNKHAFRSQCYLYTLMLVHFIVDFAQIIHNMEWLMSAWYNIALFALTVAVPFIGFIILAFRIPECKTKTVIISNDRKI